MLRIGCIYRNLGPSSSCPLATYSILITFAGGRATVWRSHSFEAHEVEPYSQLILLIVKSFLIDCRFSSRELLLHFS